MRSLRLLFPLLTLAGAPVCAAEAPGTPPLPPPAPVPTIRMPSFGPTALDAPPERRVLQLRIAPVMAGREVE